MEISPGSQKPYIIPMKDPGKNAAHRVELRATTIETESRITLSWDQAADDLIHSFEVTHQMTFIPGTLNEWEYETARKIQSEKYVDPAWTGRI